MYTHCVTFLMKEDKRYMPISEHDVELLSILREKNQHVMYLHDVGHPCTAHLTPRTSGA